MADLAGSSMSHGWLDDAKRKRERSTNMAELTQEQLLNYVDQAIVALECETVRVCTTHEIQAYLQAEFGIKEPLERIKEASDIVFEVRLENEESEE
jgi:hypothetical protein